jgi:hypothetical protein
MELSRGAVFDPPKRSDGYDKVAMVFDVPTYTAGIGTTLENRYNVLFPNSKTNSWGTITHIFVGDGTEVYMKAQLSTPKTVLIGESVGFANNSVQFTIG